MSARLVTIFLPDASAQAAHAVCQKHAVRIWLQSAHGVGDVVTCVVQSRYVQRLLDDLEDQFSGLPGFNIVVSPIEALVPPLYETPETARPLAAPTRKASPLEHFFSRDRLSTEELYDDIEESVRFTPSFVMTVMASALIAGLGMRSGQTAVVIGAMVIAPFLGPAIGLAMAATVGDGGLARRASTALAAGALLVLALMTLVGAFIHVDVMVPELRSRTVVSPADVALALASGAAGVLAFSRGASVSLVGVMIAVALVPPLSAAGLMLGSGHPELSLKAIYLFGTNLICINVAGIATFLGQGLPPKNWRLTAGLLMIWCVPLGLLVAALYGWFGVNVFG